VTIAAGATSATIAIGVKGDKIVELTENFTVNLTGIAAGPALLTNATGTGTIRNDD
jgi:hypothetical protein